MQIHHAWRHCLIGILFLLVPVAHAMEDGFYMGVGAGLSKMDAPAATINGQSSNASKTGMAGRIFAGGQFNAHGAFEMGYTHYAPASYDVKPPGGSQPQIRLSAIDFSFRGILPVAGSGIAVFGMPGLALAHASGSGSLATTPGGKGPTSTSLRPQLGAGISYEINQSWMMDVTMRHLFGSGIIRSSNLMLLSFSWHLVDLKCGEFLC